MRMKCALWCADALYAIGEFDVDDTMLNVFGALLGYGVLSVCRRILAFLFGCFRRTAHEAKRKGGPAQ